MQSDQKVQDAIDNSWVDTSAPIKWRPYLRLSRFDRPVGAWLLFLPCTFGAFAAGALAEAPLLQVAPFILVCALGAWLMRGAGCTWNDIVDRKIDAQVERTKSRPIPSGAVSISAALIWMGVQAIISLAALLTLSWPAIFTAMAALIIVAIYPFAKRFTNWPQIVLGLAMNWGVLVAWVEIVGAIDIWAIALYIALVFWTLFYDTIYAFLDIDDDEQIGVKSTARALKANPRHWFVGFIVMIGILMFVTINGVTINTINNSAIIFAIFVAGLVLFVSELNKQRSQFEPDNRLLCLEQFRGNIHIGQYLAFFWFLGYLVSL